MKKKSFTMEDNYEKIRHKVINNTNWAKSTIGRELAREIRPQVRRMYNKPGHRFLQATVQSWARRQEGDIIIGYKDPAKISFLKHVDWLDKMKWKYDQVNDPIKPTVIKNIPMITKLIGEAIAAKEIKNYV